MNKRTKFTLFFFMILLVLCSSRLTKKKSKNLQVKLHELNKLSEINSIVKMNNELFQEFIKESPRNYDFILMLTANSPHRSCSMCRQVFEEYVLVAKSFTHIDMKKLFFGVIDFDESAEVFNELKVSSVPVFIYISSKRKLEKADILETDRIGFKAEDIAKWINERTGVEIHIYRAPSQSVTVAMIMFFIFVGFVLFNGDYSFLINPSFWGVILVFFTLFMTSAQVFNHIRGPPFMHYTEKETGLVHGNPYYQFLAETYIIFGLYSAIFFGFIILIEAGADHERNRTVLILGLCLIIVCFTFLLAIVKIKVPGYPYGIPMPVLLTFSVKSLAYALHVLVHFLFSYYPRYRLYCGMILISIYFWNFNPFGADSYIK